VSKITVFDIETYRALFVFCAKTYDEETRKCIDTYTVSCNKDFTTQSMKAIEDCFVKSDYIVSYNGSRFDIPILTKIAKDWKQLGSVPVKYIHTDANALITYDEHGNQQARKLLNRRDWVVKHFDLLNCCLLNKSLKQWEMYEELPIKVLPYDPAEPVLTEEQEQEIIEYCMHDVTCTAEIFWRMGYDKCGIGRPPFKAYRFCFNKLTPELAYRFDRPTASFASAIIYKVNTPIPPKTVNPFELFDLTSFDVPTGLKITIAKIAKGELPTSTLYNGVTYGKGGAHFIKPGKHENVYEFDVQSMYPNIIIKWGLLKTKEANETYRNVMLERLEAKKTSGVMD
jgi:DNA polymerase elongation subunit (family B)